jgi:diguanylate cyclase (GGDEF)-like protein
MALMAGIAASLVLAVYGSGSVAGTLGAVLLVSLLVNGALIAALVELRREAKWRAEAETKLGLTLDNMRDGIVAFDADLRLLVANRRYQQIYALPDHLVAPGTPFAAIIDTLRQRRPDMPPTEQFIKDFLARLRKGNMAPILLKTPTMTVAVSYRPRPGGGWVSTHEDVTQRVRMEDRLQHMALHDALTDLANRALLCQRLEEALTPGQELAVLCLDLDRFKEVNDTLGHPAGDELLRQVAERLSACVRDGDTVARFGGDEFAIVQLGPQPSSSTVVAERVIGSLSAPYVIEGETVTIGTSIGIAIPPRHGTQPAQLLKRADLALYVAKKEGRGAYRLFEEAMERRQPARRGSGEG